MVILAKACIMTIVQPRILLQDHAFLVVVHVFFFNTGVTVILKLQVRRLTVLTEACTVLKYDPPHWL